MINKTFPVEFSFFFWVRNVTPSSQLACGPRGFNLMIFDSVQLWVRDECPREQLIILYDEEISNFCIR